MIINISSTKKQEVIDITREIENAVKQSGVDNGLCTVFAEHATAAIIINESHDPNVGKDLLKALNQAFPEHNDYIHDRVDNNAGAHIKAAVLGPGESIPVNDNKLELGTWQAVMLVELDGPKERKINVSFS